jgi:hypothetical protein
MHVCGYGVCRLAAEPIKARRYKGSCTCGSLHSSNYDTYTCHCRGSKNCKILGWKDGNFLNGHHCPLVTLLPPSRSWAPTAMSHGNWAHGSWPPRAAHTKSAALTITAAILWFPELYRLLHSGSWMRDIARNKSFSGLTSCERDCLSLLMRMLGLRPCISNRKWSSSK